MKNAIAVGILVIGFATTALASQYWIVLDSNTNRCWVVTERPNDPAIRLVGALPYPTWRQAESIMNATEVCTAD